MSTVRLLVADADPKCRTAIREVVTTDHFVLDEALDGVSAIKLFRRHEYALALLNLDLPELDGHNVFIQLRKLSDIPIFMLCDRPTETGCLEAYRFGADDVIRKPFLPQELLARIKVFLRRGGTLGSTPLPAATPVTYQGLYIDAFSRTVFVDESPIELTPRQYALLAFLSQNPNRAFSRSQLLDEVWGPDFTGSERTVDTHIKMLRSQLKPYERCLATVWGFGYRFEP